MKDHELLKTLKTLRNTERETLSKILNHLEEVERRRAYAKLGYSNMFKYLTRELGYSDSSAARRMQALKLVKRAPQAKAMISSGELNLVTASKVNKFLDNKKETKSLEMFRGKNAAECDAILGECRDNFSKARGETACGHEQVRVSLNLKKSTLDKFEKLKGMLKKQDSDSLLDELCDIALNRIEKQNLKINKSRGSKKRRYFPSAVKKTALRRARYTCEFNNCDETRGLEFDHVSPVALGGINSLSNCRVLCKTHNQLQAIAVFGQAKMDNYIN